MEKTFDVQMVVRVWEKWCCKKKCLRGLVAVEAVKVYGSVCFGLHWFYMVYRGAGKWDRFEPLFLLDSSKK